MKIMTGVGRLSDLGATHSVGYKGGNWEFAGNPNPHINIQMENLQRSLEAARRSQDPKKL